MSILFIRYVLKIINFYFLAGIAGSCIPLHDSAKCPLDGIERSMRCPCFLLFYSRTDIFGHLERCVTGNISVFSFAHSFQVLG